MHPDMTRLNEGLEEPVCFDVMQRWFQQIGLEKRLKEKNLLVREEVCSPAWESGLNGIVPGAMNSPKDCLLIQRLFPAWCFKSCRTSQSFRNSRRFLERWAGNRRLLTISSARHLPKPIT